jgi:hypothetical protein
MANLAGVSLDPEVQEASDGFEVLPQGKYKIVIIGDELKTTKAGTGKYLAVNLQVVEGAHTAKQVTDNINLVNPSQVCQQIGQGTLKKICTLCGVQYPPQDTIELYGKPMEVSIDIQTFKSNKTGDELQSNNVKSYGKVALTTAPGPKGVDSENAPW